MKDDAWIVQQFLNERDARELSGHGATLGAFERIRDRLSAAERGQKDALAQMCKTARELGEMKGKLEGSELAGVVDGWRERAEAAEARVATLRAVLEPFAIADDDSLVARQCPDHATLAIGPAGERILYRDIRRARATLQEIENNDS